MNERMTNDYDGCGFPSSLPLQYYLCMVVPNQIKSLYFRHLAHRT